MTLKIGMMRCPRCWIYTFKARCPVCGTPTEVPHPKPFKYSISGKA